MHPLHITPQQLRFAQERAGDLTLAPTDDSDHDALLARLDKAAEAYRCEVDNPHATRDSVAVRWQALSDARLACIKHLGHVPERIAGVWF